MTSTDSTPRIEWFSQADIAACLVPSLDDIRAGAPHRDAAHGIFTGCAAPAGQSDRVAFDCADVLSRLRRAGFGTLSYGAFDMIGRRVLGAYLLRELTPASFTRPYVENRLYEADPRFAALRDSGFPVAWRLDALEADARRGADRRALALASLLRAHAMQSGVMFCLSAPRLDLRVVVSLTSEAHDADWIDDRVIGGALALSLGVHRAVQPLLDARIRGARAFSLAQEEEDVLEQLVHGLSDQEIARAMRTSLHKVGAQIRSLEKAFNAQNRAQLAYLAARRARV